MAKSPRNRKRLVVPQDEARAAQQEPAPGQGARGEAAARGASKVILYVAVLVFVLFMGTIFALFKLTGGEDIRWKAELQSIKRAHAAGRHQEAAEAMAQFGKDWPKAQATFDWNRTMGEYHLAAGDRETAAEHLLRAAAIDPTEPGIRAQAGEVLWDLGKRTEAAQLFKDEIEKTERAVGDHDRANYHLGTLLLEQGQPVQAMQHFQAITDREAWKEQLDEVAARIEREVIAPAREKANAPPSTSATP